MNLKTEALQIDNRAVIFRQLKTLEGELAGVKRERDARAKEEGEKQKRIEDLNQQVSAKGAELEKERAGAERIKAMEGVLAEVKRERDARAKETEEVQKSVEDLNQQVSAKGAELEKERAAGAERIKAMEGVLAEVKSERDVRVKEGQKPEKKQSSPCCSCIKCKRN